MFKKKIEVKNEILKRMELTEKSFLLIDDISEIQKTFQSTYTYIKSFLDALYVNPKFIARIISLSKIEDVKNHLAPFFTNNFYENFLSAQSLENDLIYIIYILLKEEIDSMPDFNSPEKFLENTACGYVLEQLTEKIDIKAFCKLNIIKVVQDLEWSFSGKKICLDVGVIIKGLNKQKESVNKNNNNNIDKPFKKANTVRKSYSIFSAGDEIIENNTSSISRLNTFSSFDGFGEKEFMKQKKNLEDSREFNSKYIIDINPKQFGKNENENIKEFIECQTDKNKNNWSINSNENFISNVFKGEKSEDIISIYILSFIKVIESVNLLFKNLLENIGIIPYSIKCICKMIYSLLKNKFPNIKRLYLNAFMSRFFIDKILLSFLKNPIFGALINEYMISPETINNLITISQIISKICQGHLYCQTEENGNYTPFNKFILEKINDVYQYYQNIEEVILPEFIEKIDNEEINEIINKEPFNQKSICFSYEQLYALIINVSNNKNVLFQEGKEKTLSKIFSKIDKSANMKIIEDIMKEKIYENFPVKENNNKNNPSKKKNVKDKEVQTREIEKYFLITNLIINNDFAKLFESEKEKALFQIKEIKHPETKEDQEKNSLIKVKNIICTILYYLREINIFDFNPISISLSDTGHIFKAIKKLIKTSYFRINDSIPFDWYVSSLFQCLNKLPQKYIENDYELLYTELKKDIINSTNTFDVSVLSDLSDKLKYGQRKKKFFEKAEKRLVDITLNEKVQEILEKLKVPCELFFCYNEKDKKIDVKEVKKDDNTLKFLDSMIFVEQSRYIKTCNLITDFTKYFPNIVKSSIFFGENEKIFEMLKKLEIPKTIINYLNIVRNKLQHIKIKIFSNEEEFKDINNKIYDFVMEKIYDKIFPTFQSDKDTSLNNLCGKLSWTEPKNFIIDKKDYIFDSFLPDVIYNFRKIEEEKSPRKKLEYLKKIFVCINQVQNFNGVDGSKAGVDDIINILSYAFVKAQLTMANTNFEYLKFFVKMNSEEDHFLTQLSVVTEFIMKINHEKLRVTKEEYEENCQKAYDEFLNI